MSLVRTAAALAAAAAVLTACTSSTSAGHGAATPTSPVTVDGLPSDTGVTGPPATPTTSATTGTTSPAATSTAASLPKDTCTGSQLTLRLFSAGAVPSEEIALITFTNSGTTPCSMFGFPGVSLRLAGRQLVQASRSPVTAKTVRLLPGENAQAQITDFSTCNAPLSDTVRIYAPNLTTFVDKTFQLRACRFEVDPVSHS